MLASHVIYLFRGMWVFTLLAQTVYCVQPFLCVLADELFNYHEATANSNDQSAIQDLCKNLSCSKKVITLAELFYRHGTSCSADCLADELIQ